MTNNQLNEVYAYLLGKRLVKSKYDFADQLGYHRTYVSNLLSNAKPVTFPVAEALYNKFSINTEWMLKGEGEMLALNEDSAEYIINSTSDAKRKAKQLRATADFLVKLADELDGGKQVSSGKKSRKKKE